ncbi:TrkA family potassium uptake protein [Desulfococcaceae bacterium OttesenSCG-928-F15]|nr:TrkA family potassium uptake protein [Desulfococcaceae bacterium OttesenSCG-928-F15]
MKKTLEVGIIGLGKFGRQLGIMLTELGHNVLGVDIDPQRVHAVQDIFPQTYVADATDKTALAQLKFQSCDTVAVSVGSTMDSSILITLNLQELGAKDILVKAVSAAHRKVLTKLGVGRVLEPEIDVATQVAYRLNTPGMLDLLPIGSGVLIQELIVDKWAGKSLAELKLRDTNGLLVAAICAANDTEYVFVPDPHQSLTQGDKMLLIGYQKALSGIVP